MGKEKIKVVDKCANMFYLVLTQENIFSYKNS